MHCIQVVAYKVKSCLYLSRFTIFLNFWDRLPVLLKLVPVYVAKFHIQFASKLILAVSLAGTDVSGCSDEVTARVRGNMSLKRAVGITEKGACEVGISPEHIEMLVDVIGCSKLRKFPF